MLLAVNLLLCLTALCAFGVLDAYLADISLRRLSACLLCLAMAGALLLEDIPITDALYANIGGFFLPSMGAVTICAAAKRGTRKYLLMMTLFVGIGAYLFNQITYRALEAAPELSIVLQGFFCLLFANILDSQAKPILMMSVLGFQLCDIAGYIGTIVSGQSAYTVLGDGLKAVVIIGLVVCAVTICRLRSVLRRIWLKYTKHRPMKEAQPETP